jgi:hypothetical protein
MMLHVIGSTGAMHVAVRVMMSSCYCSLRHRGFVHRFESLLLKISDIPSYVSVV